MNDMKHSRADNMSGRFQPYPEYRVSGVAWLGDVPAHWATSKLKFAARCSVSNVDKKAVEGEEPVRLCNYVDVYYREHIDSSVPFMEATATAAQIEKFALQLGDVMITKDSESPDDIAVPAVVTENLEAVVCGYHLALLRPNVDQVYGDFLGRALSASGVRDHFWSVATGITRYGLTLNDIGTALVPLPPFPEQQAIAAFLNRETARIDALIAKKQRLVELLQEKRAALISHAVTRGLDPASPLKDSGIEWLGQIPAHWDTTKLKFACSKIVDCPHETPVYDPSGDYAVIRTADLVPGTLDLSNAYKVDKDEFHKRIRREPLKPADIVYGREGERWGYAALVPHWPEVCLGQRMMQFRAARNFDPRYLMWMLNSGPVYQQGAVETAGSTSPHVNVETIKNYWLCSPPTAEQTQVADFIEQQTGVMDETASKASKAIERLQEYRASLIAHAVTGKIDVREAVEA